MDSCTGVEQDLDKALAKFNSLNDNANRMLQDVIDQVENLRREISKREYFHITFVLCMTYLCTMTFVFYTRKVFVYIYDLQNIF